MDGLVFVYLRCMQRAQNVVSHVLKSVVSVHDALCALLGLLVTKTPRRHGSNLQERLHCLDRLNSTNILCFASYVV